jgi:hypothetical protein
MTNGLPRARLRKGGIVDPDAIVGSVHHDGLKFGAQDDLDRRSPRMASDVGSQ